MKLKRLIPNKIKTRYAIYKESNKLQELPYHPFELGYLRNIGKENLHEIFNSEKISQQWRELTDLREQFKLPNLKGGVNEGDQRAIFHLLKALNVKSALEIGTHIGASAAHICLALRQQEDARFVTVDIRDMNDQEKRPWRDLNSLYSPKELVNRVGGEAFAEFKVSPSLDFMRQCDKKFDFIFLDGDHRASTVYQEIPIALKLLNPGGVILLHDHFPENKPLWSDGKVSPGTYLATQRLIKENSALDILPLGALPWNTKLNSNFTSLALVTTSGSDDS